MKRMILPLLAAVTFSGSLAGCGRSGSEDFALTVKRPVVSVFAPFSDVQVQSEARRLFPSLKLQRSRPSDNEVLYTFPVEGEDPAMIRLVFESIDGGKATVVHATVDVPAVTMVIAGKPKVISEFLVEAGLRRLIKNATASIEAGSSGADASREFAALLTAVAIATDKTAMARATELMNDPAKAAVAMAALGGGEYFGSGTSSGTENPDNPEGSGGEVMEDPNARLRDEERDRRRADYHEDKALRANSAGNDDTQGASTEPEPE